MKAQRIIEQCERSRVKLSVVGGHLELRYPRGALTPELEADLVSHKSDVIKLLGNGKFVYVVTVDDKELIVISQSPNMIDLKAAVELKFGADRVGIVRQWR